MGWAPIELGEHKYEIAPQRVAYLNAKLGSLEELLELDLGGETGGFVQALGDNAHRLLKIFIPDLMDEWEWRGYASPTAAERGEYDEVADRSPTFEQIVNAFNAVFAVNRLDLFKSLGKLLKPEFLQAIIQREISRSILKGSESSPAESGEPVPTSSSTSDRTESPTAESSESESLAA